MSNREDSVESQTSIVVIPGDNLVNRVDLSVPKARWSLYGARPWMDSYTIPKRKTRRYFGNGVCVILFVTVCILLIIFLHLKFGPPYSS